MHSQSRSGTVRAQRGKTAIELAEKVYSNPSRPKSAGIRPTRHSVYLLHAASSTLSSSSSTTSLSSHRLSAAKPSPRRATKSLRQELQDCRAEACRLREWQRRLQVAADEKVQWMLRWEARLQVAGRADPTQSRFANLSPAELASFLDSGTSMVTATSQQLLNSPLDLQHLEASLDLERSRAARLKAAVRDAETRLRGTLEASTRCQALSTAETPQPRGPEALAAARHLREEVHEIERRVGEVRAEQDGLLRERARLCAELSTIRSRVDAGTPEQVELHVRIGDAESQRRRLESEVQSQTIELKARAEELDAARREHLKALEERVSSALRRSENEAALADFLEKRH